MIDTPKEVWWEIYGFIIIIITYNVIRAYKEMMRLKEWY